jgi:oligopeptide/dipeptide ABC transporter ATP-binding protein
MCICVHLWLFPRLGPCKFVGRWFDMMAPLLHVADLKTHFFTFRGTRVIKAVDGVSFTLNDGETLGLVGESGCGKTTTCLSIVGLLPPAGRIVGGSIEFEGEDLTRLSPRALRRIRGRRIAMILQDPMASLNPLFTIYRQVAEPAFFHQRLRGRSLKERVRALLGAVRIPSPAARMREYPHQMSGGMRQRIVGAIALSGGPKLIIADEPTTNLDVTIQAQYLNLLKDLQRETGVALIFVTHDLCIVAKMCDKVAVMYAGKLVEYRTVRELFSDPKHPYTKALLGAVPKLGSKEPLDTIPGQPPNLASLPAGCHFHPRCPLAMPRCALEAPGDFRLGDAGMARCWLVDHEAEVANGQATS